MFPFDSALDGWLGIAWLAGLMEVGFLVTWLAADLGRIRRTPFIAVLGVVTFGSGSAYLAWSGAGTHFWTYHWAWGLLGAAVASAVMLVIVRRLPRKARPANMPALIAWEGVVYGVAEGVLLSVLPVAIAWQAGRSFGWPTGATVVAALIATVAMTAIHHYGYPEFRNRLMRYPVVMCGALGVAYLVTGNPIAPVVGHIVLHVAMLARGMVLPPHEKEEGLEQPVVRAA